MNWIICSKRWDRTVTDCSNSKDRCVDDSSQVEIESGCACAQVCARCSLQTTMLLLSKRPLPTCSGPYQDDIAIKTTELHDSVCTLFFSMSNFAQ